MLHAKTDNCSLALWVRQFELKCSNRVRLKASGLYAGYPHQSSVLVVKLAERISATARQENNRRITGE